MVWKIKIKCRENKLTVTRYVQNVHYWHEHKHSSVLLATDQLRHQSATAPSLATYAADASGRWWKDEPVGDFCHLAKVVILVPFSDLWLFICPVECLYYRGVSFLPYMVKFHSLPSFFSPPLVSQNPVREFGEGRSPRRFYLFKPRNRGWWQRFSVVLKCENL